MTALRAHLIRRWTATVRLRTVPRVSRRRSSRTSSGDAPYALQPPKTKLAAWRLKRGATQPEMVADTGIPINTYQRYEAGDYERVPYARLVNCAIVLEVPVDELIEDHFKRWTVIDAETAPEPPNVPRWKQRAST